MLLSPSNVGLFPHLKEQSLILRLATVSSRMGYGQPSKFKFSNETDPDWLKYQVKSLGTLGEENGTSKGGVG